MHVRNYTQTNKTSSRLSLATHTLTHHKWSSNSHSILAGSMARGRARRTTNESIWIWVKHTLATFAIESTYSHTFYNISGCTCGFPFVFHQRFATLEKAAKCALYTLILYTLLEVWLLFFLILYNVWILNIAFVMLLILPLNLVIKFIENIFLYLNRVWNIRCPCKCYFFGHAERRSKAAFCLRPLNLLALTVKYAIYTHIHTHTVGCTHTLVQCVIQKCMRWGTCKQQAEPSCTCNSV